MNKETKLQLILAIIAWLVAVVLAYGAVKADVQVVKTVQEMQYKQIQQQLEDIKLQLTRIEDAQ